MPRRLVIVQPYVPEYRVAFFSRLRAKLLPDVELEIAAGAPPASHAGRMDSSPTSVDRDVNLREVNILNVNFSTYGWSVLWDKPDAIIYPLQASILELTPLAAKKNRPRLGVWGHVGAYVKQPNAIDVALEKWIMRRSDHVFAYTARGAAVARAAGVREASVTTVQNAVDTSYLTTVTDDDLIALRHEFGIGDRPCLGYVGGLDAPKRVDKLVEILDHLDASGSRHVLLVGGNGDNRDLLRPAIARGQAIYLGVAGPIEKKAILNLSEALINPGRIGLIAVEALAANLPILTLTGALHGPEAEYLEEGVTMATFSDTRELSDAVLHASFPTSRHGSSAAPSLERMVENFALGATVLLGE